ncbi:hypothetical protein V8C43DRAFT_269669 [Trichoderma afarasin]
MTNWCIASPAAPEPSQVTPCCKWRVSTPTQREARSSSQHATKASASVCRPDGLRCIGPALAWSPMQQSMFMFAQAAHHWLASGGEATALVQQIAAGHLIER